MGAAPDSNERAWWRVVYLNQVSCSSSYYLQGSLLLTLLACTFKLLQVRVFTTQRSSCFYSNFFYESFSSERASTETHKYTHSVSIKADVCLFTYLLNAVHVDYLRPHGVLLTTGRYFQKHVVPLHPGSLCSPSVCLCQTAHWFILKCFHISNNQLLAELQRCNVSCHFSQWSLFRGTSTWP